VEHLIVCKACNHGATLHRGAGCEFPRCSCHGTQQNVVDDALEDAREEMRQQWRGSDLPP